MDWFRLYGDMPSDPKIGTLTDAEFRTWIELLCAACKEERDGATGMSNETINWMLRRDVTVTLARLLERQLVTKSETGEYVIVAWNKRQYKSDSSAARTKAWREKNHKNSTVKSSDKRVTSQKRHSDALDTETDTETDINALSGKPSDADLTAKAKQAVDYLNEKTHSEYRHVPSNLNLVRARIKEGYSLEEVKAVIDVKAAEWNGDAAMQKFLRPATLFNATKFAQYAGRLPGGASDWWTAAGYGSAFEAENAGVTRHTAGGPA